MKALDLSNRRFGRLLAIKKKGKRGRSITWECICDCGLISEVTVSHLMNGSTKSCGCFKQQQLHTRGLVHGHTGGNKRSPEYEAWMMMKRRCYNPKDKYYYNYGGRGIIVCQSWRHSFGCFLKDIGLRPSKDHSLDRINGDGNYEKSNCKWSTRKEQSINRRTTRWVSIEGKKYSLKDFAKGNNLSYPALWHMLKSKTIEEAIHYYNTKKKKP